MQVKAGKRSKTFSNEIVSRTIAKSRLLHHALNRGLVIRALRIRTSSRKCTTSANRFYGKDRS